MLIACSYSFSLFSLDVFLQQHHTVGAFDSVSCSSLTTSSILRMLRTVSVARVSALMETSNGCTTNSSMILEIPPCHTRTQRTLSVAKTWLFRPRRVTEERRVLTLRTLIPASLSPWACLLRSSVTVEMGLRPAFSASVEGMTSRASL